MDSNYNSFKEDENKLKKINQKLKFENLENYDSTSIYEYDTSLPEEKNIIRKFILKERGQFYRKNKDYKKAIEFYKILLNNSYFANDYYIYRHLAIKYHTIKDYDNLLDIIKKFFKSGIYANACQTNWFLYKLIELESNKYITNKEIDEILEYFEKKGMLNKYKENEPIYLADRIFQRRNGDIEVDTQYRYEQQQKKYEIKEKGRYLERCNLYDEALELYWEQIRTTAKGASDFYKRLAMIYEKLGDYESELNVLNLFYKNRYHIVGKTTKKYFEKRLDNVNFALRTSYTVQDFLNGEVTVNSINNKSNKNTNTKNHELFFRYVELYEKGYLTKEEFDKKKKELL